MDRAFSDEDIRAFLAGNAATYPSHVSLIQAVVGMLWPEGPPPDGPERVVRACLGLAPTAPGEPPWRSDLAL